MLISNESTVGHCLIRGNVWVQWLGLCDSFLLSARIDGNADDSRNNDEPY